ncbi:MAG TPA: hypothetical protein VNH40_00970 [Gaiellaceae bacterium]|nr:hypothetical protein [Gaiellaceae bacterium]
MTAGPDETRQAREEGAARAVRRRRRGDVERLASETADRWNGQARPHDCTIAFGGILRLPLATRRVPGWALGTVQESRLNFALGRDGRLYWNSGPGGSRGVGPDGRFETPGVFGPRRLSDDQDVLDAVMRLLEEG